MITSPEPIFWIARLAEHIPLYLSILLLPPEEHSTYLELKFLSLSANKGFKVSCLPWQTASNMIAFHEFDKKGLFLAASYHQLLLFQLTN